MSTRDFLVELGTEELPPKALNSLSQAFEAEILKGIREALGKDADTLLATATVKRYAAPRRLAVLIEQLTDEIPSSSTTVLGPPINICYDANGKPTKALEGFAKKNGTTVDQLSEVSGKVAFEKVSEATPLSGLLPEIVSNALAKLPIPKRMRWGASRVEFVRPVHWLVMLFGDEVVDCEILGLKAGRKTRGHRFHYNHEIELIAPQQYAETLRETGKVVADFAERRESIRNQVVAEGQAIDGVAQIDDDLLDEVTALNEWPVALTGRFEERFLEVPAEALISSMAEHQKYFHVVDSNGQLMPNFITIANIVSKDPQQVIEGNEKVIRPRLADAAFFFETDKKQTLESRIEKLKSIVFQQELGTLHDKAVRIATLAERIAADLNEDPAKAKRAAMLAKTDLMTDMVYEFTDLQGLMGYHYALHDGEDEQVALAQNEQYMPRFAGDELPQTAPGIAVAIADRLDTLTGLFGINQPPTGSKDPFALRRAALGVLRIIVERNLNLDLRELLSVAADSHANLPARDGLEDSVLDFMLDRFRAWYEEEGIPADVFLSVLAVRPTRPLDFDQRVKAVSHFRTLAEAEALAAANKRVSNILSKQGVSDESAVSEAALQDDAEKALYSALNALQGSLDAAFADGDYRQALESLASLRGDVDRFFDEVMVMADDEALRNNRLALLAQLRSQFLGVADISVLGA
ncbi:glycine--tRNA ligase subunit beta [Marinobacterium arenosum]|uniref:glycine--tRNA ligase subunit beta n=1 Tax=Marinobacterium arenosum TaxID=2862496 RepID=UPI001C939FE3|nr:glycine--tRNA ligase subunit beta [Marinobacterium arenosum]MBY4677723.1 glycine--tRNA ligase subunit beta [Marinobacterium arenosum]